MSALVWVAVASLVFWKAAHERMALVAAFFLFLLRLPPWINAAMVVALCVLTFVRIPFIHPLRVERGRTLSILLLAFGAALTVLALLRDLEPGPFVTAPLCVICLYFLGAGLLRRPRPA